MPSGKYGFSVLGTNEAKLGQKILIAECAEPKLRGFLIGVPFVSYAFGILLTYTLGVLLHWRAVAWCCNILPIASVFALYFAPESPVWLVRKGFLSRAERSLNWLRCDDIVAKRELQELMRRCENDNSAANANEDILKACAKSSVLKPLIILNLFHIMMILSGTYLIVFYAVDILSEFGTDVDSMTAAVYTAVVRLLFTISACFMLYYLNRRTLSILSGFGSGVSTTILAIFTYIRLGQPKSSVDTVVPAVCILCYIAANTNFMVMPGVMVGELLPAQIRGRVAGYVFTAFNFFFFIVAKVFPYVSQRLKSHGVFLMFGLASFGASLVMYLLLPETKGKSLGEIEDYFCEKNWLWMRRNKSDEKDVRKEKLLKV
ncbi:Facilitated trehalose transporter Tret1-2 like [Pseudolycoriella hygida]|uniref:Facilitated trehalose transporter Tret1-2 like n=1 Tax=Pseudolycoriella hygida TaxID=35572 RepID=A0A9Q0N8R1_9DIPT|nr:Facilitated trehalose transporter Tret1-2 like [Pseudolycoriella hygida]